MRIVLIVFSFAALLLAAAHAGPAYPPAAGHESIEWCDIWVSHANETNLPRVLLIGDSITRDYYPGVEKSLEGKAYVTRLATSRFAGDPVLLQEIALVLDNTKFDIIHFNNGMHGWQHTEEEYRKAFPNLVKTIRVQAPHAKLIWATTTPLKAAQPHSPTDPSDDRIAARNAIGLAAIQGQNIAVDDLNALVRGHPEYHSDNVHFNSQGIQLEAQQVAASIEPLLNHQITEVHR
ncbi:MAG TPA: SGNH/GDSL hydrolase family protein [Verrucomicrobiae bacterium]|jgi:lysophospholipase L1-like esterase|nr:SGNH/GDSL hydrolase family protein [Verrucomicrobiae bacterium]